MVILNILKQISVDEILRYVFIEIFLPALTAGALLLMVLSTWTLTVVWGSTFTLCCYLLIPSGLIAACLYTGIKRDPVVASTPK